MFFTRDFLVLQGDVSSYRLPLPQQHAEELLLHIPFSVVIREVDVFHVCVLSALLIQC